MKKRWKFLLGFLALLILFVGFKGALFRSVVNYHEIGRRDIADLGNKIIGVTQTDSADLTIEQIAVVAQRIVSDSLQFTTGKVSNLSHDALRTGKANCVGYAALFGSIANNIILSNGQTERFRTQHLIGKINVIGYDVHKIIDNPFFKDHDYNSLEDIETGRKIYIDASVYDYFGIEQVK